MNMPPLKEAPLFFSYIVIQGLYVVPVSMRQWCLAYYFCKKVLYVLKLLLFSSLKILDLAVEILSFDNLLSRVIW